MRQLQTLIKRNSKMFFKDKGMFLTSLVTPMILLVLYVTFLAKAYKDMFVAFMPEGTDVALVNATVGSQLMTSLIAVSCVTVAFCSNLLMVQDKITGALSDFKMTPVKRTTLSLSYYISTVFITLIVALVGTILCLIYLAVVGWYMSFGDIMLILLDMFLLVMFGTALSSIINLFLKTEGQCAAVGTIVSAGYGFICGAYMPISQFGAGLRNCLTFLPGTHGTALIRNHTMNGVLKEMKSLGWPSDVTESIKDAMDANLYLFEHKIETWQMYLVLVGSIILLIGAYILISYLLGKKTSRKSRKNK